MPIYNAAEVYEMAEKLEQDGAAFYRKAADQADHDDTRQFLLGLAAMEDEHEKLFAEMRKSAKAILDYDPDNECARYLQSMTEGKVFPGVRSGKLTGNESVADILEIAIGFEKDAVVFFQSLKAMTRDEKDRQDIDDLIRQEVGHIVDLRTWQRNLND